MHVLLEIWNVILRYRNRSYHSISTVTIVSQYRRDPSLYLLKCPECTDTWNMSAYGWQTALIWSWQAWTISTLNCTHAFQCSMYPSLHVLASQCPSPIPCSPQTYCQIHCLLTMYQLCYVSLVWTHFHSDISSKKEHPAILLDEIQTIPISSTTFACGWVPLRLSIMSYISY